ncbi:phage terminase large subunit [Rhizobium puerariae]|uniref:Phage terminase large subunit n=1 Tax=Rhizobium puerariae TaxID=1585791 RepID=A0ABV6AN43_9HYPH
MTSTASKLSSVNLPVPPATMLRLIRLEKARREKAAELERVAQDAEAIRARCATLEGFIKEFWSVLEPKRELKFGWALRAMCRHLEAVTEGRIQFLLMTVPPGMMKSLLMVFWTAWEWGACGRPDMQVLATSYSQPNVLRDNLKLRRLVESEKFQFLWPLKLRDDQNAKGKFENTGNGFSEARPFSSMTGGRGDRVKVDDPHSTETAESDAERQTTIRIFREGISDRLNDVTTSAIVIIMQRLHTQDVAGVALDLDIGFVHLSLPMEFEVERVSPNGRRTGGPCRTYVNGDLFFEDPRTQDGELLFPERFPRDEVERLKKSKGSYAWAGQYQQRPAPRDGGMFKREWFSDRFVDEAQRGTVWVRHWDLAASTRNTSARTAGVKMGKQPDGSFVIGHIAKTRSEGHAVRQLIQMTAEIDGTGVRISLPQDPGQAGKVQAQDYIKQLAGFTVSAQPESGDKVTRAEPFASQCEGGNVYIVRGSWNEDYIDELCLFPGSSIKDQVDASSGAFGRLLEARAAVNVTLPRERPKLNLSRQTQNWMG